MGVTYLTARLSESGRVVCFFGSRGGGARNWSFIVDRFGELVEELGKTMEVPPEYPDAPRTLGRRARVVMPRRLYLNVRAHLAVDEAAADATDDGTFAIDDAQIAPRLVSNLARAFFVRGANEPWLIGCTDTDRS